jgi:hypothetical protein
MRLIFYAAPSDMLGKAIMQAITRQLPQENVDVCSTASNLALYLAENRNDETIAILVPADEEELINIYCMQDRFTKVPVILVLPNRDRVVEAIGHRLKPRQMFYRDERVSEAFSTPGNIAEIFTQCNVHQHTASRV